MGPTDKSNLGPVARQMAAAIVAQTIKRLELARTMQEVRQNRYEKILTRLNAAHSTIETLKKTYKLT